MQVSVYLIFINICSLQELFGVLFRTVNTFKKKLSFLFTNVNQNVIFPENIYSSEERPILVFETF